MKFLLFRRPHLKKFERLAPMAKNITTREQDYNQWYLDVIKAAQLADYSPVRGCMVIRPTGYALWAVSYTHLTLPTTPYV